MIITSETKVQTEPSQQRQIHPLQCSSEGISNLNSHQSTPRTFQNPHCEPEAGAFLSQTELPILLCSSASFAVQ